MTGSGPECVKTQIWGLRFISTEQKAQDRVVFFVFTDSYRSKEGYETFHARLGRILAGIRVIEAQVRIA